MSIHPIALAQKAEILADALPHLRRLHGRTLVIGYGGAAMTKAGLRAAFGSDVTMLRLVGINPLVVHGGAPQLDDLPTRLGIGSAYAAGMPANEQEGMDIVEMVLGKLNQDIVGLINQHGGKAIGLSGQDGRFIRARRMASPPPGKRRGAPEIGRVGEIASIDPDILDLHCSRHFIPVVMPIGVGAGGESYHLDGDRVAAKLAEIVGAEKLVLMADAPGIVDRAGQTIASLNPAGVDALLAGGGVGEDLPAKLAAAGDAVKSGVPAAHVVDGRMPHALLLELLCSEGMGTAILSARMPTATSYTRQDRLRKAKG